MVHVAKVATLSVDPVAKNRNLKCIDDWEKIKKFTTWSLTFTSKNADELQKWDTSLKTSEVFSNMMISVS